MASEAAEQVAAPAVSSNTQLAPGIHTPITECGWKGGDRDLACFFHVKEDYSAASGGAFE